MRKFNLASTLVIVLTLSAATLALSFELATTIEKNGNTFSVSGTGYTRMNLIKIKTKEKGTIILKGRVAVHQGMANIVMWSKVNGKFYFSKLPGLLNFSAATPTSFSIPFSSPKDIITEVVLEIELPQGGQIKIDSLALSKS